MRVNVSAWENIRLPCNFSSDPLLIVDPAGSHLDCINHNLIITRGLHSVTTLHKKQSINSNRFLIYCNKFDLYVRRGSNLRAIIEIICQRHTLNWCVVFPLMRFYMLLIKESTGRSKSFIITGRVRTYLLIYQ